MCVRACLGPLIMKVYPLLKLHCKEMYIRECGGFSNWFGCLCLEGQHLLMGSRRTMKEEGASRLHSQQVVPRSLLPSMSSSIHT